MEADIAGIGARIDAEFDRSREKVRELRQKPLGERRDRQDRVTQFEKACGKLQDLWGPRLEALKQSLGERLRISVSTRTHRRQAQVSFTSSLARIKLAFTAMTDAQVRTLILEYTLDILPAVISFPCRDRLVQPLEQPDPAAIEAWMDGRILEFVRTYLSLYECEYSLGGRIVEDPVAHVRFPECAAAATLQRHGKTFHFISPETRDEFEVRTAKWALDLPGP